MANLQNHTNNNPSTRIPRPLIFLGKVIQFVSSNLAAKYVARLFSTPIKFKAPERELMMRESAKKERFKVEKLRKDIQVYIYGYSRVKVLLVHGWAGRGTQLYNLADKILENKMMVVSFDGPAHGLSEGKRTNMLEFVETIRAVYEKYGPFDLAIGHSFGGMSLINAVADGLNINKLVTIGADNSIPEFFDYFVHKMELKNIVSWKLARMFEKKYNRNLNDLSSEVQARRIDIPVLVLHDSKDKYVPVSSAMAIRQNLKNGQILMTSDLGHHRIFKDPEVIERIIDFIR